MYQVIVAICFAHVHCKWLYVYKHMNEQQFHRKLTHLVQSDVFTAPPLFPSLAFTKKFPHFHIPQTIVCARAVDFSISILTACSST